MCEREEQVGKRSLANRVHLCANDDSTSLG